MTFSLHESIAPGTYEASVCSAPERLSQRPTNSGVRIRVQKLQIPSVEVPIRRPRLEKLLAKSLDTFPATLISGRAGTGKTSVAVAVAKDLPRVAWYSIDSTDRSWAVFAGHFAASLETAYGETPDGLVPTPSSVETVLTESLAGIADPTLIVLDDVHHIFDASWFDEFFNLLLRSLPENAQLLLLSRTKPPGPLWRLRSKAMLNVIDEKILAFDTAETATLLESLEIPAKLAEVIQSTSFGRISKILQFTGNKSPFIPPSLSS
ncbi:MAG: AAA family ATPase [Pyrinomonadaceae bacterium]